MAYYESTDPSGGDRWGERGDYGSRFSGERRPWESAGGMEDFDRERRFNYQRGSRFSDEGRSPTPGYNYGSARRRMREDWDNPDYRRDFESGERPWGGGGGYGRYGRSPQGGRDYDDLGYGGAPATRYEGGYSRPGRQGMWQSRSSRGEHYGRGPQGYTRSDDRIQEEVSDELMRNGEIDASEITVEVKDRVVTLKGTVESKRIKRMAEDICEEVLGVEDVQNRLKISQEDRFSRSEGPNGSQRGEQSRK